MDIQRYPETHRREFQPLPHIRRGFGCIPHPQKGQAQMHTPSGRVLLLKVSSTTPQLTKTYHHNRNGNQSWQGKIQANQERDMRGVRHETLPLSYIQKDGAVED